MHGGLAIKRKNIGYTNLQDFHWLMSVIDDLVFCHTTAYLLPLVKF